MSLREGSSEEQEPFGETWRGKEHMRVLGLEAQKLQWVLIAAS